MREALDDLRLRLEVWWFTRRSVEVQVRRACGHTEDIRLLRRGLQWRLVAYRATQCSRCKFLECMAELKAKNSWTGL